MRKPDWLKVPLPNSREFAEVRGLLHVLDLHSVCQEARCPNMGECFRAGTATFLILGNICTRNCRYCNVGHGRPGPVDEAEPERLVEAVKALRLRYIVITSVTRDDLPDGGAEIFARSIELLRQEIPDVPFGEPVGSDRCDEWSQRAVEAVEVLGEGVPEDYVCKAF